MEPTTGVKEGIDTKSLSEKVYDYLADRIIEGTIHYGETLNLKQIAMELKVSTMPIRDAIKRLEMEDLVTVNPRSSCHVKIPTQKSVLEAFESRKFFELYSIEKIYDTVLPEDLRCLDKIIRQMDEVLGNRKGEDRLRAYIKLDRLFHVELCRLARNRFIDKFYREVSLHLNMTYTYGIGVPPDLPGTFLDHQELIRRLADHSVEAVEILKKHLRRSRENIMNGRVFNSLP